MLVRALVPLALSSALLFFGPSAQGDLDLDLDLDVQAIESVEPLAQTEPDSVTPLDPLTESLLVSRLETLDREIPGLQGR